jgi:hypothetical protein
LDAVEATIDWYRIYAVTQDKKTRPLDMYPTCAGQIKACKDAAANKGVVWV